MPDNYAKVRPGDALSIPAAAWNDILDAVAFVKDLRSRGGFRPEDQSRGLNLVRVKNSTGATLRRNAVVGLSDPIFPPDTSVDAFLREVTFRGVVPSASHRGKFAVLLSPAPPDRVVRAYVAGVCPVRLHKVDDDHTCADVDAGNTDELISSEDGSAQILYFQPDADSYSFSYGDSQGSGWAYVRLGTTCAGSSSGGRRLDRCDCPDPPYEVEVDCGDCGAYYGGGTVMPRYWVLTILSVETPPYGEGYAYCEGSDCSALIGRKITMANEADPFGSGYGDGGQDAPAYEVGELGSCTWSGGGCFKAELTLDDDDWKLTILDRNDCVMAVLRTPQSGFACCGTNMSWTPEPYAACDVEVSLAPHECTCCPEAQPCPPADEVVCLGTDCCLESCACDLQITVSDLASPTPIPCTQFDLDCCTIDGDDCPAPVGDPGRLSCYKCDSLPIGDRACGGMNGVYDLRWVSNCQWKFRGIPGGGTKTVAAVMTLSGREWTLTVRGEDGQTAVFRTVNWQCETLVEFEYVGGSCPVLGTAPSAQMQLCANVT